MTLALAARFQRIRRAPPEFILRVWDHERLERKHLAGRCFREDEHANGDQNFSVGFDLRGNKFFCNVCGHGFNGDAVDLVKKVRGCSTVEALEVVETLLGNKIVINQQAEPLPSLPLEERVAVYRTLLADQDVGQWPKPMWRYLTVDRGLLPDTIERFSLTYLYNPVTTPKRLRTAFPLEVLQRAHVMNGGGNMLGYGHPLIIPCWRQGKIVSLQYRRRPDDKQPDRYKGPWHLDDMDYFYNRDAADEVGESPLYLCEGVPDTMTATQCGYRAVGIFGVTKYRLETFQRLSHGPVYLALHSDAPGQRATRNIGQFLVEQGYSVHVVVLPKDLDLNEVYVAGGEKAIHALPVVEFHDWKNQKEGVTICQ